ncbi:MAG: sulfatase-like hydrolase/transferase, partial [Dermabacteraceae bacterium]
MSTVDQRPDVLVIVADDLGFGDLSCYGATAYATPHLDALARRGRLFRDAHASSSVCTPSR